MTLVAETCPKCGSGGPHPFTATPQYKHSGRLDCVECRKFIKWVSKSDDDPTKYKRPKSHTSLVKKFSRGFCEMCGIGEGDLPDGEALEGHHVEEYQHGGEPTRENTWILCTACHSLVNWRRTYVAHLLSLASKLTRWRNDN